MNIKKLEKLLESYVAYCKFQKGLSQKTLKA